MRAISMLLVALLGLLGGGVLSGALADSQQYSLAEQADFYFDPLPDRPVNSALIDHFEEKVSLGRRLFYDPRLSLSQTVSCHSCHNLAMGGADGRSVSIGHGGQSGSRNSPTVFNAVLQISQFWDGRARTLVEQAGFPITSSFEMASSDPLICEVLSSMPDYVAEFGRAFPQRKNPICFATTRQALAAFVSTLLTPDAPLDRYLNGDQQALDEQQQAGMQQFIDVGCVKCHFSVNLGGNGYYRFGVVHQPESRYRPVDDLGRNVVMDTLTQDYVFKVPTLRNVALTSPYFHSGAAQTLQEAIGVMGWTQLDKKLTEIQIHQLEAFLHGLTGRIPPITLPDLPPSTVRTPRPAH